MVLLAFSSATGCGGGSTTTTPPPPPAASEFVFLAELAIGPAVIRSYKLDTSTGDLIEVGTPAPSAWVRPLVTDPKGRFLYATTVKTNTYQIWGYSIDSSTGQLAPVPGSPYYLTTVFGKGDLAVEPAGKFLYYDQLAFSIDQTTGALTQLQNVTVPSALYAITKDEVWLNFSCPGTEGTLSSYKIDLTTGGFTPLSNLVFPCSPSAVIDPSVDPSGRFIYVGDAIVQLDPTTGTMSQFGSTLTYQFVFDPSTHFVYAQDSTNNIIGFAMDPNTGALSQLAGFPMPLAGGGLPFGIDASGKFLVTTTGATYEIDQTSGSLMPKSGQVLTDSTAVALYPSGE